MKILFIISASIAIKKCSGILRHLSSQKIFIDCIVTNNAKKMININEDAFINTSEFFCLEQKYNLKVYYSYLKYYYYYF